MNGVRLGGVERAFRAEGEWPALKLSALEEPNEGHVKVATMWDGLEMSKQRGPRGRVAPTIEHLLCFWWCSELHTASFHL